MHEFVSMAVYLYMPVCMYARVGFLCTSVEIGVASLCLSLLYLKLFSLLFHMNTFNLY